MTSLFPSQSPGSVLPAPASNSMPMTHDPMAIHPHVNKHIMNFLNTSEGKDVVNTIMAGMPKEKSLIMARVKK